MKIKDLYNLFINTLSISIDSRKIEKDCIFFALKGDNFDGNNFASQSISKGAKYAVIDNPKFASDERFILVNDVYKTFVELAKYHRKQLKCPVIAITGTNGKTTTKELISSVLSEKYNINYTKGNFNNHIGLPFTILQTKQETEILILEMGANHKGEIAYLCDIAKPDFGIITNVGKAHLEGFGTPEEIFKTKTELYNAIITYGKGIFVNVGDNKLFNLAKHKLAYTYGINDGIIKGKISNVYPLLEIIWYYNNNVYNQKTNLFGSYNIYNVLSAVSIGLYFNIEPQKIIKAIEKYIPSNNRSQLVITGKNNHVILDAYNANPSSMNLAVSDFISLKKKNKIVILGSMLELGDFSNEEHIKILEIIKSNSFIKSVFVGKEFYNFKDKYPESYFFENHQKTSKFLKDNEIKNSYILIKGSRGIALENVLNSL